MSAAMQPRSLGLQPVRGLGRSLAAQPIGSAISSKSFKEHRTVCHAAMDASSGGMAISGGAWELRAPGEPGSKVVPAGPQLMNRSISTNPLETLGNAADALAHKAACLALPVVRSKPLSIAAAAAVGTLYALGGSLPQLFVHGLPHGVMDFAANNGGVLASAIAALLLPALAAVGGAWHLHTHFAASRHALTGSLPAWWGAAAAALRLVALAGAVSALRTPSPSVLSGAAAGLFFLLSLAAAPPAAAAIAQAASQSLSKLTAQAGLDAAAASTAEASASGSGSQHSLAPFAMVVASDAAGLLLIGLGSALPAVACAVLGGAIAASLAVAAQQATAALAAQEIREGDEVAVHVSLHLDNGIEVDSTIGSHPLRFTATAAALAEAIRQEEEEQQQQQQAASSAAQAAEDAQGTTAEVASSGAIDAIADGGQRLAVLAPMLQEAVLGAVKGEQVRLPFWNPPPEEGGYTNPELRWWQPADDVRRKFKTLPQTGQVFFYPLRPDGVSWVPVRVGTVTETYVELDANHALAGAHGHELVARVTVVDHKRAGAA